MSRTLAPPPPQFDLDGEPVVGSFAGGLPPGEPTPRGLVERLRRKRWLYFALSSDEIWLSSAVVDLGYASSAFVFAVDRVRQAMAYERTTIGRPGAADVTREVATFRHGAASVRLAQTSAAIHVPGLDLEVEVASALAPPAIGAIVRLEGGAVTATEKRGLLTARGRLAIGGRRFALGEALAGYDYSSGFMPRRTRWQWAFALGRTTRGDPVGFNLVQGFVGEAECAVFIGGEVRSLASPRFVFERSRPGEPWRIEGKGIDLTFSPAAVYAQRTNLVVVRSHFVQPAGDFEGRILLRAGRDLELSGVPGVVEDQDVVW